MKGKADIYFCAYCELVFGVFSSLPVPVKGKCASNGVQHVDGGCQLFTISLPCW